MEYYVIKRRNNTKESVDFTKISRRLNNLAAGLGVDTRLIARETIHNVNNGITTSDLDKIAAEKSYSRITDNPNYGVLAAYLVIDDHRKNTKNDDLWGESFIKKMEYLNKENVISDDFINCLHKLGARADRIIDYTRDFLLDYFGFFTLMKKYLLRVDGKVIERPQDLYLRVAVQLSENIKDPEEQYSFVKKNYDLLSRGKIMHATPTLFNAGLKNKQFSSCVLLTMEDSAESILYSIARCGIMSKYSFGIGAAMQHIRSKGQPIHGTNGTSNGMIGFCEIADKTMEEFDQGGGRRRGSMAIYNEMHHPDLLDFIAIRKQRSDKKINEHIFPALWISDLFMERLVNDEIWSFFDSYKHDELNNTFGDEYKRIYLQLEREKRYEKQMRARDILTEIYFVGCQAGFPYFLFKDSINRRNNQSNAGIIKCSNLCCEIVEYTTPDSYSSCNLASLCLPKFVMDMSFRKENDDTFPESACFDWGELKTCVRQLVDNLNHLIDITWSPCEQIDKNNVALRPIGIGVQGLADVFFKFKYPFDSQDARNLNKEIFEHIYFYALERSNELAKLEGSYFYFEGSPLSRGQFQFDLYDSFDYDSLTIPKHNWEALRKSIMQYGVRNSLLVACMPTASTAQIQGNTEGIDPLTSNIYKRETLAGEFLVVNKYLINELQNLGLWNESTKQQIEARGGSIQGIDEIPQLIQDIYKTVWEISQKAVIDLAADRQYFIDQSQSMNLHIANVEMSHLYSLLRYGWERQLKTGCYYLRMNPSKENTKSVPKMKCDGEVCDMCSA